jgi:hypothetical protein
MADFTMKPQVDVTAVASILQKKAIAEAEAKQQQRTQRMTELTQTIKLATDLSNSMVENSKKRQKQAFVTALSESMAATVPDVKKPMVGPMLPVEADRPSESFVGPMSLTEAPRPEVATPDFARQNLMRAAVNVAPDDAAKSLFTASKYGGLGNPNDPRNIKSVTGPDGINRFVRVTPEGVFNLDGTQVPPEEAATLQQAYAPIVLNTPSGPMTVPRTQPGLINTATEKPSATGKNSPEQFTIPEMKRIDTVKTQLWDDPVFKVTQTKAAELESAEALLQTENWVGDVALQTTLAKTVARDAGALSDSDRVQYRSSPQIFRRIKTAVSRWVTGEIRPEDRDDIAEAIRMVKLKNQDMSNRRVEMRLNQLGKSVKNADKEWLRAYLYEGSEPTQRPPLEDIFGEE